MDIGSIFLTLTVLILFILFVSTPFMQKQRKLIPEEHDVSSLMAENERILNALQELDFDNALGKIPSEDYPGMRFGLMQKGVAILHKLDEYQQVSSSQDAASLLETELAARQVYSAQPSTPDEISKDEDIEALIARRKAEQKGKTAGFCPKCGNPILVMDTFCPKCGNSLK